MCIRDRDSILAHINPKEAALLKSQGGRGEPNPETGIIEFADDEELPATSYPVSEPTEPVARDLPPEPVALPEPSFSGQDYANMFKQTERTYPSATRAIAPAQTAAPAATPSFAQAQPIDISQISPTAPGMEQGLSLIHISEPTRPY